jgi:hypothetical protein
VASQLECQTQSEIIAAKWKSLEEVDQQCPESTLVTIATTQPFHHLDFLVTGLVE